MKSNFSLFISLTFYISDLYELNRKNVLSHLSVLLVHHFGPHWNISTPIAHIKGKGFVQTFMVRRGWTLWLSPRLTWAHPPAFFCSFLFMFKKTLMDCHDIWYTKCLIMCLLIVAIIWPFLLYPHLVNICGSKLSVITIIGWSSMDFRHLFRSLLGWIVISLVVPGLIMLHHYRVTLSNTLVYNKIPEKQMKFPSSSAVVHVKLQLGNVSTT